MENKELIKIVNENGRKAVSGRELHEKLGSKRQFSDWIKGRITKYGFVENVDFTKVSLISQNCEIKKGGDRKSLDYILTLDTAKELCMIENNELGRKFRKYFIECEKELQTYKAPQTFLEAMELVVLKEKERIAEEERRIEAENRTNMLIHSNKTYTASEIAKELGFTSAIVFNKILHEEGIQFKKNGTWLPYSKYSDKNYMSIKQTELASGRIVYSSRWTGEGREFLLNKFKDKMALVKGE